MGERLITNVRRATFEKFMDMHVGFFDSPLHIPSILVSRLSIDARRIRDLLDRLEPIAENYFLVAAALLVCYSPAGDWRLSTLALVMSPFCLVSVYLQNVYVFSLSEAIDAELLTYLRNLRCSLFDEYLVVNCDAYPCFVKLELNLVVKKGLKRDKVCAGKRYEP